MANISQLQIGGTNYNLRALKAISTQLTNQNLNDFKDEDFTVYYAAGSNTVTNTPLTSGQAFGLYVYRNATGYRVQELYGQDGSK